MKASDQTLKQRKIQVHDREQWSVTQTVRYLLDMIVELVMRENAFEQNDVFVNLGLHLTPISATEHTAATYA